MADLEDFKVDSHVPTKLIQLPLQSTDPAVQKAIEKAQSRISADYGRTIPRNPTEANRHRTWIVDDEGNITSTIIDWNDN